MTSKSATKRWKEHTGDAKHNAKSMPIARAILKHGKENFEISVLEECSDFEELKEREKFWIQELDTFYGEGYNATLGGEGVVGRIFSDEHKRKLSEAKKGSKHSEESKRKMSESRKGKITWNKGIPHTKETKVKMSASHMGEKNHFYGKQHTEEAKILISKASKGRVVSEEKREKLSKASKGENNSKAKLIEKNVLEIKEMIKEGCSTDFIANKFKVSYSCILRIKSGKTWKHI